MATDNINLYLGVDFSTQQLKAIVIDSNINIITEEVIVYDTHLPEFHTLGGVTRHVGEPNRVTAPTLMWVKALDLLLEKLKHKINLNQISGISGSGQQHGSVYWSRVGVEHLQNLDSAKSLFENLSNSFIVDQSPIWMDSSTYNECKSLEKIANGPLELARLTGSRAYERFTGNQIAKILKNVTSQSIERISLVSSFGASLFCGQVAPIDWSDGSGMNLLDIHKKTWIPSLLEECGGSELCAKLGKSVCTSSIISNIGSYYTQRYGFAPNCQIVAFTGDNPSSLAGHPVRQGDIVISLGTSDTLFVWLEEPKPSLMGHIFVNPIDSNAYMALLCYKNGSLARENIRNICANGDWEEFNKIFLSTQPGNDGMIGMYFMETEITPNIQGIFRYDANNAKVESFSPSHEVRSILEGQILAKFVHSTSLGYCVSDNSRILVTGGASKNPHILQLVADIFNTPVYVVTGTTNSTCLGAAIRALYCTTTSNNNSSSSSSSFSDLVEKAISCKLMAKPRLEYVDVYISMLTRYIELEHTILSNISSV